MWILLDEDVPIPAVQLIAKVLGDHVVEHVQAKGWSGKDDTPLLRDASRAGFDAIVTNDSSQLEDAKETKAIKESGLHHVRYAQRHQGLKGLGLAMGALVAALPGLIEELEAAQGQRLAAVNGLDPNNSKRFKTIDPKRNPPKYWPR